MHYRGNTNNTNNNDDNIKIKKALVSESVSVLEVVYRNRIGTEKMWISRSLGCTDTSVACIQTHSENVHIVDVDCAVEGSKGEI